MFQLCICKVSSCNYTKFVHIQNLQALNRTEAGHIMPSSILCPECGQKIGKGSTFCIKCGARIPEDVESHDSDEKGEPDLSTDEMGFDERDEELMADALLLLDDDTEPLSEKEEPEEILPDIPEDLLTVEDEPVLPEDKPLDEPTIPASAEELKWEVDEVEGEMGGLKEIEPPKVSDTPPDFVVKEYDHAEEDLTWESVESEPKEGMPFKEVEPPKVVDTPESLPSHLFTDKREEDETRDAVAHLFPEGRGVSRDFIDVVVGKPERVKIEDPMRELDTPSCPNCGISLTGDEFVYPPYVYEAMGKARIEAGEKFLEEREFEAGIESFEKAMKLYERAENEKMVEECRYLIDKGYSEMAQDHYDLAERHKKSDEYEWAVIQYRKAREIFMFTTDAKKRAKCAEKIRESYKDWGKLLESEGDDFAKKGESRAALKKYKEAAKKYKLGGEEKRIGKLDKKIMEA
ncbi:MAG: zinc-ribbon domain-containing protein [Candidatus Lokiarchaeota archaeon]|nr:zinc-ribbon domain-containing protein [Candidatus Lokiarchaeota archaeon]